MRLPLLFFFIGLFFTGHCQDFWAPENAQWYYCLCRDDSDNYFYNYEHYTVSGDTIIMDKKCKIISSALNTEYMYSEDSVVYYYFNKGFHKIYDFTAKLYETVQFSIRAFSLDTYEVDTTFLINYFVENIEYIDYDGEVLKKYYTRPIDIEDLHHYYLVNDYSYIEKVGNEWQFLYDIPRLTVWDCQTFLRCYSDNQISYISDWWALKNKPCDYNLINKLDEQKYAGFNIYPNPVSDKLYFDIAGSGSDKIYSASIINVTGNKAHQQNSIKNNAEINISHLASGIYMLIISDKNKVIKNKKFVKL